MKKPSHQNKINGAKRRQWAHPTVRLPRSVVPSASFGYLTYVILTVGEQLLADHLASSVVTALLVQALDLLAFMLSRRLPRRGSRS